MQKARRHHISGSDRLWAHGFRVSFTPLLGVLFTFPSRYLCAIGLPGVLSLGGWCRLLRTGLLAACFGQGSSDPALLRVQAWLALVPRTGLSPAMARLSRRLPLRSLLPCRLPFNPARASTPAVWALPLSLAATRGVTVVFLSSDYWDVSVRRVRLPSGGMPCLRMAGCPIRTPTDLWPFAPPRGLSRPAASFVASGSQGILRAPCLASRSRLSRTACSHMPRSLVCLFVFVSAFTFPSCQRTVQDLSCPSGECGARTHDPRLAKPVL